MDSIVTDLVANSDGSVAATDGATVVSGMKVLGQPATIDGTGVHLTQPAADPGSSLIALAARRGHGPLQQALDPLNQLLLDTLGSANADINQLLEQGGITVRLIEPNEVKAGPEASRLASGVLVTITYNGSTEPVLSNILNLIPVESLPSQGVGPIPFSSPQSIVLALKATHVETIGLAAGPCTSRLAPPFALPTLPSTGGLSSSGTTGRAFTTRPGPAGGGGGGAEADGRARSDRRLRSAFVGGEPLAAAVSALLLLMAGIGLLVRIGSPGRQRPLRRQLVVPRRTRPCPTDR